MIILYSWKPLYLPPIVYATLIKKKTGKIMSNNWQQIFLMNAFAFVCEQKHKIISQCYQSTTLSGSVIRMTSNAPRSTLGKPLFLHTIAFFFQEILSYNLPKRRKHLYHICPATLACVHDAANVTGFLIIHHILLTFLPISMRMMLMHDRTRHLR